MQTIANSVGAVRSGSTLFAQTCLSENLGKLLYVIVTRGKFYSALLPEKVENSLIAEQVQISSGKNVKTAEPLIQTD